MAMPRHRLRSRRDTLDLSQAEVARRLGVADETYAAWERGTATPRRGFKARLARVLDVSVAEMTVMLDVDVPSLNGHAVPSWLGHLASLEQAAAEIRAYETTAVHGLLQTAGYAAAVERAGPIDRSDEGITRRVQTRVARQRVLTRDPDPLELSVVLDESVLRRVAGDRAVMAAQLDRLAGLSDWPNVDLRILPLDAGVFPFGSFALLTSPDHPGPYMAVTEDRAGPHYLDRPHELDAHAALFADLVEAALGPAESVDLINRTSKEYR